MTNAQKIKQKINNMTISELAEFIIEHCEGCDHCIYEDEYTCNKDCNYGVEAWMRKKGE